MAIRHSTSPSGDTVPALAGMSRASFAAWFHQVTGQSPGSYVTGVRMQRAEDALTRTNATLAEIAATVGYRNEYAFATAFRRQHGLGPRPLARGPAPARAVGRAAGTRWFWARHTLGL
jgi:AraC-like DNA-binding protein